MLKVVIRIGIGLLFFANALSAQATNLVVYDDQSENGFNDGCSFGGVAGDFDVAHTVTVHSGARSIRFTPDNFNAVSWCAPATYSAATDYTGIDFWVNGGTTGSQNVDVVLGLAGNPVSFASLTSLNGGNPIPSATWVHIQAPFTSGVLAYNGMFDKISLQDESGAVQENMYFDDVTLVGAASVSEQNYIFGDSFEPEYMFVPQWANSSIRVYQRNTNSTNFSFVREAPLGGGIKPNAIAFAPDGSLWVVDDGNIRLRRYTLQSILNSANPAAITIVGPVGASSADIFDLQFFGAYAYVSQSDFGATNRIVKFAVSDLNAGNNVSTNLTNASLSVPAALAFDAQGRLWICNYNDNNNPTIVRMNTGTGNVDKIGTSVAVGTRASLSNPEGLAFDSYGSLWVGNNGEPTISVYSESQLNDNAFGATAPIYQIDVAPGVVFAGTGFVGGIAMDRQGDLRANFEYALSVLSYTFTALPYTSTPLATLAGATTNPGRGGIAIWPVPSTLHR